MAKSSNKLKMGHFQGSAVNKIIKNTKKMWKLSTMFSKKKINIFCPQKVEKTTLKSCSEKLKSTFFPLTASTAQMAQTEKFMFQNMAYRPTVYRTGVVMDFLPQVNCTKMYTCV